MRVPQCDAAQAVYTPAESDRTRRGRACYVLLLPPGPAQGRLAQTVMLASDPLRVLRRLRDDYGPVFTLRTTNGPMVVVGAAEELTRLTELDPGSAHAGDARRRVLPQA